MKKFCEARTHYGELEENCINILYKAKKRCITQKVFTRFTLHFSLHVCKETS